MCVSPLRTPGMVRHRLSNPASQIEALRTARASFSGQLHTGRDKDKAAESTAACWLSGSESLRAWMLPSEKTLKHLWDDSTRSYRLGQGQQAASSSHHSGLNKQPFFLTTRSWRGRGGAAWDWHIHLRVPVLLAGSVSFRRRWAWEEDSQKHLYGMGPCLSLRKLREWEMTKQPFS